MNFWRPFCSGAAAPSPVSPRRRCWKLSRRCRKASGPIPLALWKAWLADRVEELAVAVSAGKPKLFAEQVRWAASLFAARSVPVGNIETALDSLRSVLAKELPENAHSG